MLIDREECIRWNPAYRVEILENGRVFLCSEREKQVLKGKTSYLLAPLLVQGTMTAAELVQKLEKSAAPEVVYFTLAELEKKNLIQSSPSLLPEETAAYCGLLGVPESEAAMRLKQYPVFIEGNSELPLLLELLGVRCVETSKEAELSLVCVEDYLACGFESDKPWMLCKPRGSEIWIGPLFEPGKTGCYHCLAVRLRMNRLEESYIQQKQKLDNFFSPTHAFLDTGLAERLIAAEVFKCVVLGKNEQVEGKLQTVDTLNLKVREHLLIKRPNCAHCGDASSKRDFRIQLKRRRVNDKEGGYRTLSAEETVKKFSPLISPITGVVKYLEPLCEANGSPFHIYASGSNWSLPDFHHGGSLNSFRKNCGGKGATESSAKASGLCEALERASGALHGDEPRILASYRQLKEEAIHPDAVLLFSEKQYAERERFNAASHSFWKVPPLFPEERMLSWTPLYSLTEQRVKYLPTSCCYFSASEEAWRGHADSNGCAAGNCLEEAILQGFFELVERDSIAIWWYNRICCPSVDFRSFSHSYIESLLKEYANLDRELWVLDITSDLEIPVFVALSRLKSSCSEEIYMGFGAHLDAEIALLRALTELNQFFGMDKFWEEDCFGDGEQDVLDKKIIKDWMVYTKLLNHHYLQKGKQQKRASDYVKWESADLLEDIEACRKIVERRGMEILVLDQTRPEIGLSVARVVVPGLRHFWPRFAPGRLYDVPVEMGRLKAPLKESELNPIGMFL